MSISNKYKQVIIQKYKIGDISPLLEIHRKKHFRKIYKWLSRLMDKYFPDKHNTKKTLDKLIVRYFFEQYVEDSYLEKKEDAFFPSMNREYDALEDDLSYFLDRNEELVKVVYKKMDIGKRVDIAIRKMHNYYNSKIYNSKKKLIEIKTVISKDNNICNLEYYNNGIKKDKYTVILRKELY